MNDSDWLPLCDQRSVRWPRNFSGKFRPRGTLHGSELNRKTRGPDNVLGPRAPASNLNSTTAILSASIG